MINRVTVGFVLLVLVSGCQHDPLKVPVTTAGEQMRIHVVKKGDTLYSIAFRYGLDYKSVAVANRISAPYTIHINQRVRLSPQSASVRSVTASPGSSQVQAKVAPTTPADKVAAVAGFDGSAGIIWRWPFDGDVVGQYSLSGKVNKGIDIRGHTGDSVRSSADGVVVYAGGGLRGYGKLVIIKHDDRYLSAYGHNQSILVKEGDEVDAGEVVATIGGPNGDKDILHFEIRRDGKPEDPLGYLPRRIDDS